MRHSIDEQAVLLRQLSGELQASRSPGAQWLGRVLLTWLQHGGDLPALLGVRPGRGSRLTVQSLTKRDEIRRRMMDLSRAAGGDQCASRWLRDLDLVPDDLAADVHRLQELGAPSSIRAFERARKATRHTR